MLNRVQVAGVALVILSIWVGGVAAEIFNARTVTIWSMPAVLIGAAIVAATVIIEKRQSNR